jgi:hypothetical protein
MQLKRSISFFTIWRKGSEFRAFLLFVALAFVSPWASANTILCRNNDKAVRTLRSDKTPDGGCRAVYTKQGIDQVVGSSTRDNGCDSILTTIRGTLESSSWKCKDLKSSLVTTLSE